MKRISVFGCGWLGRPLAQRLAAKYDVACSYRRSDFVPPEGVRCYENPGPGSAYWECDVCIVAISTRDRYLETLGAVADAVARDATVILCSSTSVYREYDCTVDENTPIRDVSKQRAAELLMQEKRPDLVIVRFGGLMGDDRVSGRWKNVSVFTDGPVNYIHRDDAAGILERIVDTGMRHGLFNAVAPKHPLRSQLHRANAERFGFEAGTFEGETGRIVESAHVANVLEYRFARPDPLTFWDD